MNKVILLLIAVFGGINAYNVGSLPWEPRGYHGLELKLVKEFLPKNPIILEAGAHHGEDTVIMAATWPEATIFAFEPSPGDFAMLQTAVSNFPNIYIFQLGLFSQTGFYRFYVSQCNGCSSLLEDNHLPNGLDYGDQPVQVYCKNLDEWAEENDVSKIDYMWLDMEGAELYVLNSSPRILSTVHVISCEINFFYYRKGVSQFRDLYNFLTEKGFKLYKIWGSPTHQATGVFVRDTE